MENNQHENKPAVTGIKEYQAVLELQQNGVVVIDQERVIEYINPTAGALLNLTPSKCLGNEFPFSVTPDFPLEINIDADAHRWVFMTASEITWEAKKGYLIQIKDISEHKREEKRLTTAVAAAETRAAELEALKFVADQLNQTSLRDDAIRAGLETVLALFKVTTAWLLLPEENGSVQIFAAHNAPSIVRIEKRILDQDFHCLWLEKVLKGELTEPGMLNYSDCLDKIGLPFSSTMIHYAIPLFLDDKPLGLLNLVPMVEKELGIQEYKLLKTIGLQFAIALQHSIPLTFAKLPGVYPQPAGQTGRVIGNELDLPAVLKNVLQLAVQLTGAEAGTLGMLNENLSNLAFQTYFPMEAPQQIFMRSEDLLWETVDTGKTVLLKEDWPADRLPMFFASGARSMVITPLCAGNRLLGVMVLYSLDEKNPLNEFNEAIAILLGKQAGNVIQNAQLFKEILQLTVTDPLTGLHNQKSFITQAVKEMERTWRYKRPLSLISVVIDDIRSINESYGREIGDRIMQALGQICTESLRKVDIIGRYAGNNFIILLPETDTASARDVAERLRMKTEAWSLDTSEGSVTFTISLGIAGLVDSEVIDLERFIDRANQALYTAIQAGGNRALVWERTKKK